jgi:hypothetical protein
MFHGETRPRSSPFFNEASRDRHFSALSKSYSNRLLIAIRNIYMSSRQFLIYTMISDDEIRKSRGLEWIYFCWGWLEKSPKWPPPPSPTPPPRSLFYWNGFQFSPIYLSGNREYIQIRSRDKRLPRPSGLREHVPRRLSGFREPVSSFVGSCGDCISLEINLAEGVLFEGTSHRRRLSWLRKPVLTRGCPGWGNQSKKEAAQSKNEAVLVEETRLTRGCPDWGNQSKPEAVLIEETSLNPRLSWLRKPV